MAVDLRFRVFSGSQLLKAALLSEPMTPRALSLRLPLPHAAKDNLLLLKGSPVYSLLLWSVCLASLTPAKSLPRRT